MDPLSEVLSLLKPQSYMFGGFELRGAWSLKFAAPDAIKCYVLVSGSCWLSVEGFDDMRLEPGDGILLARGVPFRIASDLKLPSVDVEAVFPAKLEGEVISYGDGEGEGCSGIGGHFDLAGEHAETLLGMLPPVVHLHQPADRAALHWMVERMLAELRVPQPGGYVIAQHLADMMLAQALRLHLAEEADASVGWLFALADKRMGAAIAAMHQEPARDWTLESLAKHVGMSRTAFALKFKEKVGDSTMTYLTRWRMLRAADRLTHTDEAIGAVARSVGYESESAFSAAFKRVMGCSPSRYGAGNR